MNSIGSVTFPVAFTNAVYSVALGRTAASVGYETYPVFTYSTNNLTYKTTSANARMFFVALGK